MIRQSAVDTPEIQLILSKLLQSFSSVCAYRYNPAAIRIRIIDERFRGIDRVARDRMVRDLLRELPEQIQVDITMVVLLAPEETSDSLLNAEFDSPVETES